MWPLVPTGPDVPQGQGRHLCGSEQRASGTLLRPAPALPVTPCTPSGGLPISAFGVPEPWACAQKCSLMLSPPSPTSSPIALVLTVLDRRGHERRVD